MTRSTNIKQRNTLLHVGATVALMLAIAPGCKKKDDVGSAVAISTALPELRIVPAEIDRITLTNGSRLETKFEKRDGSWTITSPLPAGPANAEAVQAILQNLSEIKVTEKFSASASPEDLVRYELTPDKAIHVVIGRGGSTVADLSFGKYGARGQMVRVGNTKDIWSASGYSSYLYSKELKQFQDSAELRAVQADNAKKKADESAMAVTNCKNRCDNGWTLCASAASSTGNDYASEQCIKTLERCKMECLK